MTRPAWAPVVVLALAAGALFPNTATNAAPSRGAAGLYEQPEGSLRPPFVSLSGGLPERGRRALQDAVLVDAATVVLHVLSFQEPNSLGLLDLVTGTYRAIRSYPTDGPRPMESRLRRFTPGRGGEVAVLFEFRDNQGVDEHESWESFLEAFVIREGAVVSATEPVLVGGHNSSPALRPDGDFQYYAEKGGPGFEEDAHVLIRDTNGDGFKDIVIWAKRLECLPLKAPGGADPSPFVLKRESRRVMTYDPVRHAFGAPQVVEGLPDPPAGLWDKLQSSGYPENG